MEPDTIRRFEADDARHRAELAAAREETAVDFVVRYEELSDGRYVAWAEFPRGAIVGRPENLITPVDDCRSTYKVFEAAGNLMLDAGYTSCRIERALRS